MYKKLICIKIFPLVIFILVSLSISGSFPLVVGDSAQGTIVISESCNTFDSTKWSYVWNPPTVQDGTWVYDFPAYTSKNVAAQLKTDSGYGIYTIRFRTNGARVPGVDYSPFLYNATVPEPYHQELDMIEIFGENIPPDSPANEMSISSYNGNPLQHDYEYWSNPFNWEDGSWHTFECNYTAQQITIKMDGVISHISYEGQRYGQSSHPWFALPPMNFQMYAGSDGTNPSHFQLIIDSIEIRNQPVDSAEIITISNVKLSQSNPMDTNPGTGWENFTCNSNHNVILNITYPSGTSKDFVMTNTVGTDKYFYDTTLTQYGNYSYFIQMESENNSSSIYLFSIAPNWDINKDGSCNILDFSLVAAHYGEEGTPGWIREDVDNNGKIQILDLIQLSLHYHDSW